MPDNRSSSTNTPGWELFVVPGSHFDLGWCTDPAECLSYSDFIIQTAIDAITGPYPDFRFTVEYALFMEHFLRRYPHYTQTVQDLVREGKLEVCTTAVGSMEQILDGELLIRAVVEGHRWVTENLGVKPLTAQHTDLPGHAWQTPQILALAGVKYMTGSRFHPGSVLFKRVAPDGSSVIFSNHGHHYNWGRVLLRGLDHCLEHLPVQIKEIADRSPVPQMLMAEEHDLDMPNPHIVEIIDQLNSRELNYKIRCSTVTEFFTSIDSEAELPSYTGEAPYGFYTAPAFEPDIYCTSRAAENYLATAEKLSTMRHIHNLGKYPREELREGWKALFYPQDHNFAGRHGIENEEQRLNKAIFALDTGKTAVSEAKLAIAVNIEHRQEGFPITLFNPCSWPRTDVIEAKAEFRTPEMKGVRIIDGDGTEIPCQVLSIESACDGRYDFQNSENTQYTFLFIARDVPAVGYKTYYISPCEDQINYSTSLEVNGLEMRNGDLAVLFDEKGLKSLVRLSDGLELADTGDCLFAEPVVLEDRRGDLEDALEEQREKELWSDASLHWRVEKEILTGKRWKASDQPAIVEVLEAGPVRASMRVRGKVMDSEFVQVFSIYDGINHIDLNTVVEWQGTQNTLFTLPMTFAIDNPQITYESPFAAVRLDKDEFEGSYRGIGGREVQKWVDISGAGAGVTLATASGSHFLSGSSITPILVKSSYSTGDASHKMVNRGRWEFAHRIIPHSGDWREAKSYRHGWEHAAPMVNAHFHKPLDTVPNSRRLPDTGSLIHVETDHVVVTTIKQSDYTDNLVVRLFDAEGVNDPKVRVDFSFEPKSIRKVNLLEEPMSDCKHMLNKTCFAMRAWEITTLLVEV